MARRKVPPAPPSLPEEIEQQFYEALQRADLEALMGLWADDDEIFCVHPGGPRVIGAAAIRAAFESIFTNGAVDVRPERVRRVHSHSCAVHSVLEQVRVATPEGPQSAWVLATNVYLKTAHGWRLVGHHASPGSPQELPDIVESASVLH